MAICKNCGEEFQDGARFCPKCGELMNTQEKINDAVANAKMAVIAYMTIFVLVPILTGRYKTSPFLKFHVNKALTLCIGWILAVLMIFIPLIGFLLSNLMLAGLCIIEVISIIGVLKGKTEPLPIIGVIKFIK